MAGCAPFSPLPWVSPSRCLSPCAHPDESALATCDVHAHEDPAGDHRFRRDALPYLTQWLDAARAAGHTVTVGSSYRTYLEQAMFYSSLEPTQPGRAARPGHSEHELGLAVDLAFGSGDAEAWIAESASRFGFTMSYPPGREKQTGFRHEPWHFRFVGGSPAARIHDGEAASLEELFERDPELGVSGDCSDCSVADSRASCDSLDASGVCDGTVMRWCFDGTADAVDCAATGGVCKADAGGAVCGL